MSFRLVIKGNLGFEVWRDIPGYEGLYWISTYGRVKSKRKILSPTVGTDGYYHIDFYKNGKRHPFLMHRLVAQVFLSNTGNKKEVNHIDENKLNNKVENLEWVSSAENANYGTRNARVLKTKKDRGLLKKISMFNLYGEFLKCFESIADAAVYVNGNRSNIWLCCNNKAKTAYGYKWRYI